MGTSTTEAVKGNIMRNDPVRVGRPLTLSTSSRRVNKRRHQGGCLGAIALFIFVLFVIFCVLLEISFDVVVIWAIIEVVKHYTASPK